MQNELWNQFGPADAWYVNSRSCAQSPLACREIVKTSWLLACTRLAQWTAAELTREQLFSGVRTCVDEKQVTQSSCLSELVWIGKGGGGRGNSHTHTQTHKKTRVSKTYKVQLTWEMTVRFVSFRNLRKRTWQEDKWEREEEGESERRERKDESLRKEKKMLGETHRHQKHKINEGRSDDVWLLNDTLKAFILLPIPKKKKLNIETCTIWFNSKKIKMTVYL